MADERRQNGWFEAWVNERAYVRTPDDAALMRDVNAAALETLPAGSVQWAGSVAKGTAIKGSDLDLLARTNQPVTEAQRRSLAEELRGRTGRSVRVLRHVVRLDAQGERPRADVSFANATFGGRTQPDATPFRERPVRGATVRALKLWTRRDGLPRVPGWALEVLVVALDRQATADLLLPTFLRVVDWFAESGTPENVLAIVKPHASPAWRPEWTSRLTGQVEAIRNEARALRRREARRAGWTSKDDVGEWLHGAR